MKASVQTAARSDGGAGKQIFINSAKYSAHSWTACVRRIYDTSLCIIKAACVSKIDSAMRKRVPASVYLPRQVSATVRHGQEDVPQDAPRATLPRLPVGGLRLAAHWVCTRTTSFR